MALTRFKAAIWLAALSASALGAPGAAQAQFYFDSWGGRFSVPLDDRQDGYDDRRYRESRPISRAAVTSMLSRRGYRVNPSIARNDDVYLVEAVDPSGRRVRLVVDAYDATILRRLEASAPPRAASRFEDDDPWMDGDDLAPPPRVIPGVGPTQRKPEPRKPTTARVEPRAPAPKPNVAPAPAPAPQPPATAPAPATPGPAAAAPAKPAPTARAETHAEAPSTTEPAHAGAPRVIPLYKTPAEGAAPAEKPAEGAP